MPTLETVVARLDEPMPLGYCNAGTVIEVGEGVTNFQVGDRVVSNGAGNFTKQVLLPALKKTPVRLKTIASAGGVSGTHLGKKFSFEQTTTDYQKLLADPEIQAVFITTRHNQHARMVIETLEARKHVFVEKPLALNRGELEAIVVASQKSQIRNTKCTKKSERRENKSQIPRGQG